MRHKIEPQLRQENNNVHLERMNNHPKEAPQQNSMQFKNFLKSKVHRPEVTPDFIQTVRNIIHTK